MARKRLIWQLFPTYLLVTVLSLLAITIYTTRTVKNFYREQLSDNLERQALLLRPQVQQYIQELRYVALDRLIKELGSSVGVRITVMLPDGSVIADSDEFVENIQNHGERPEFLGAMTSIIGRHERYSTTVRADMTYIAIPVYSGGEVIGVIRTAFPMIELYNNLYAIYLQVFAGGTIITLIAGALCWMVSLHIMRPIEDLKQGAQRFAQGDFKNPLLPPNSTEIAGLAEAMNQMATQLDEKLRTVISQRNEQEAVLSSMVESVFAVDHEERIISLNKAAAKLLGVSSPDKVHSKPLHEVVRNTALQQFITDALHSDTSLERELVLHNKGEQYLQAGGAVLRDAYGQRFGAVIVLNDVTRLRRLEKVRRDFVANVSHELKTPITSIKGFVETLQDGAINEPDDATRFLDIIAQQAERLNNIIEDLLLLSRVEQDRESADNVLEHAPINSVIRTAVQLCLLSANAKNISIINTDSQPIEGLISPSLLEQGIVNLINNAIKYSEPGSSVRLSLESNENEIIIHVRDEGCGIASEHLPRLFERFYRVDKDRSRRQGGTGLGLAIVKHIAQLHKGYVRVESKLGVGSCFSIHLPGIGHDKAA